MKLLNAVGRILYVIGWPGLFVLLFFSRRSRVLIVCKNEILLVKNWLGDGRWHTPGGGIHRSETPEQGAVRELSEEIGINFEDSDLHELFQKRVRSRHWFRYHCYAYVIEVTKKPPVSVDKREVLTASWHTITSVKDGKVGGPVLHAMLDAWEQADRL